MADYARNKRFFSASTVLMLAIAACMSLSLIWHEPAPAAWRVPLTVALVLFSLCITSMRVLVTRRPDLPFAFVRAGGYVSSVFLSLFWLVLVRDASLGLAALLGWDSLFRALLSVPFEAGMLVSAFAMAALGMALALRVPAVRELSVPVRGLPEELDGLRFALLSDFHVGACSDGRWLRKVVERTNAQRPDFVLMAGDLADGSPERIEKELLPLAELHATYGVLTVPGNHDYYSGLEPWVEKWRGWGIEVLLNSHSDFNVKGRHLRVAGINDSCARLFPHLPEEMGPPDLTRALRSDAPADFTILLSHRPGNAAKHATHGVGLQLSGHTHGGQFFFLFPLVSHINKGFRSGLYHVGDMPLYVSPGTGMWGYAPMRWGTRSEIGVLTLKSA